jgi:hypothetical protein
MNMRSFECWFLPILAFRWGFLRLLLERARARQGGLGR